ncbi:CopG family transcriptional regulator [Kitasatospora sp. NPDC101801]|uniref:ribbon-helix-helix domain-containing protein n=1 Tax=Kitasatospora sp. NPDC101801 TaxID=3364103 RepID=UPI0038002854
MALKRTTVYAESEDLAVIKAAAARRGIAEAEIIREAIHLAAMANRVWDEPFFSSTYPSGGSLSAEDVWAERARAYEATKKAGHE